MRDVKRSKTFPRDSTRLNCVTGALLRYLEYHELPAEVLEYNCDPIISMLGRLPLENRETLFRDGVVSFESGNDLTAAQRLEEKY